MCDSPGDRVELCMLPDDPRIVREHFGSTAAYVMTIVLGLTMLFIVVSLPFISMQSSKRMRRRDPINNSGIYAQPSAQPQDPAANVRRGEYEIFSSRGRTMLNGESVDNNNNW